MVVLAFLCPKLPQSSRDFWYEDPWVSSDLLGLMLLTAEPQRRGPVVQRTDGGVRYWSFPPDFDARVRKLFTPAAGAAPDAAPGAASAPR